MKPVRALFLVLLLPGCGSRGPKAQDPRELIQQGWDEFRLQETVRSEAYFKQAAALAPEGSDLKLMALYGWGSSLIFRSPSPLEEEGKAKFEEVLRLAPKSDMAAWSLLALARLSQVVAVDHEPDFPKARAGYDRLREAFPDHAASEEAFLHREATYLAPLKPEGARQALPEILDFIKKNPNSHWLAAAWGLAAECHAILGEEEERLACEVRALEKAELDPDNPNSDFAGAYWKIASLAEFRAGDFATARKYYRKLLAEYPTDQKCFSADQALARMDRVEAALKRGEKP